MLERAFTMHLGLLLKLSKVNIMVNVYITYSYQNGTIDIMDDSGNCVCYGNSETIMYWLKNNGFEPVQNSPTIWSKQS